MRWLIVMLLAACEGMSSHRISDDVLIPDDATPPVAAGCIDDVTAGDHVYTCESRKVDARIPERCLAPGCGLILVIHGDTGTGLLMDAHLKMRELGEQNAFIVVAPTGPPFGMGYPGSTWHADDDARLVSIVEQFRDVFHVDPASIHVTGFSRGGFVTWRLLCDHADLFASAAPGGAGDGAQFGEATCFENGRMPSRKIPIAFLMGRTDVSVGYQAMVDLRDRAIAAYGATGGGDTLDGDSTYTHSSWGWIDTWDHAYENASPGPWANARGHCIPGSTTDPQAAQYAIPCAPPNSFVWGEVVVEFLKHHLKQ